ncbi:T9SS type A sorting domain-containing protein [Flavivirga eckloniae]
MTIKYFPNYLATKISLSQLANGYYIIKLLTENGKHFTQKVIKK